jgi:hypothetical protein
MIYCLSGYAKLYALKVTRVADVKELAGLVLVSVFQVVVTVGEDFEETSEVVKDEVLEYLAVDGVVVVAAWDCPSMVNMACNVLGEQDKKGTMREVSDSHRKFKIMLKPT